MTILAHQKKEAKKVINSINKHLNKYKFFLQLLGLRIIFRFIKVMEYNKYKNNIEVDNDIIIQDLKIIMNNSILEELKNSYGAGGANNSSKVLCEKLKDQIPN